MITLLAISVGTPPPRSFYLSTVISTLAMEVFNLQARALAFLALHTHHYRI
jgi:hypothetical protein